MVGIKTLSSIADFKKTIFVQLGGQMCADILDNGRQSVQETQNFQIQNACQSYPPLNLLLKK